MNVKLLLFRMALLLFILSGVQLIKAQYVHPGFGTTKTDLDFMKAKVQANAHPWIDSWNNLIADPASRNTYTAKPSTDVGGTDGTRQRAQNDGYAAYLNTLRWYVTGDESHAKCAVNILNAWANTVNAPVTGQLYMLSIWSLVGAAELLRAYPGWLEADFNKFKNMCNNYFYPSCRDFRNRCGSWPGWDGPANICCLQIAVFSDDTAKFNDAIHYYKFGGANGGGGCLINAIRENGQTTEMGRDMPHSEIGINSFLDFCDIALSQGVDLFDYADNRLFKAYEYFCKFNLNHPIDWIYYPDCDAGQTFYFPAMRFPYRVYGWDSYVIAYNYYTTVKGLDMPYTRAMIKLRGVHSLNGLTTNCPDTTTIFNSLPTPPTPADLTAIPGVSRITLKWTNPAGDISSGFNILRSTNPGGPYTNIATWTFNTSSEYVDQTVINGTTYYYKVSLSNRSATGGYSNEVSATPVSAGSVLPVGWTRQDVGTVATVGSTSYANINNNTFIIEGSGVDIWGNDSYAYTYTRTSGDITITARVYDMYQEDANSQKPKIGLMMRETLDPNSKNFTIHFGGTQTRIAAVSARTVTNGSTSWTGGNSHTWAPAWLRLKRSGNSFIGYQSLDGATWYKVDSIAISMTGTYYVGLFILHGSRDAGYTSTAGVDNVTLSGGTGSTPMAPTNFTATALNSSRIRLTWTASAAASCYDLKRSTDINGPFTIVKTGITGTTYEDYGLIPDTTYYYVLKSANAAGESADSIQANAKTLILKLPPAPIGLKATAGNMKVTLSWTATEEWTSSYNIKRSKVTGGSYSTIGTSTTANYIDNTASNDTTYYYVVSSVNSLGEGPNSAEVNAKPLMGLYRYWPFNETSGTSVACAYTGVKGTLMTTGSAFVNGKYNNGVHLDGVSSAYISLPNGLVNSLNDFTISAWVKLDASDTWARIFDFGTSTSNYMFLSPKSNNGYLRYAITTGSGEQYINATSALPTGVWTHVAVTLSGTVGVLYVNGIEVGRNNSMTLTPSNLGLTTQNYIGKSQWTDPYLKGSVDEFRIFSQALTKAQITTLKNALGQTITFDSIPGKIIGDPDFTPGATASSGLSIFYTTSNTSVASIINNNIHITGLGIANITASQTGNLNYVAALPISKPIVVSQSTGELAITDKSIINVYPNPVSDFLHIQLDEPILVNAVMYLYDSNGVLLQSDTILGNSKVMDVRKLSDGFYFMKVNNGSKEKVFKFIKCN